MRSILRKINVFVRVPSPLLFYIVKYERAANYIHTISSDFQYKKIFAEFLQNCEGKNCFQIGVKDDAWLCPHHEEPVNYWRASPDGLRVWLSDFKEIHCGTNEWDRTSLAIAAYFYGEK